MERLVAPWTTRLIANADVIKETFLRAGVGHREQYLTIRSGVDLAHLSSAAPLDLGLSAMTFKVLTAARLEAGKGLSELLRAAEQLAREPQPIIFLIAGEGPLRARLEREIREKRLTERVRLLGYQSDLAPLMKAVDCFTLPSYREGTPRAISEAMAAGLPVIATDVGGTRELVVEGETGFLVAPGDARGLAEKIAHLLSDPELRQRLGARGRERVIKEFSLDKTVREYEALYEELVRG